MPSERDKTSNDEIIDLLREIRDGQKELIGIARENHSLYAKQIDEWDKLQSQLDAPDWETWNRANKEYLGKTKQGRQLCIAMVCTGAVLIICLTIAGVTGWLD